MAKIFFRFRSTAKHILSIRLVEWDMARLVADSLFINAPTHLDNVLVTTHLGGNYFRGKRVIRQMS